MRKFIVAVGLLLSAFAADAADIQLQSRMRVEPIGYRIGLTGEIRKFDSSAVSVSPSEISVASSNMPVRLSATMTADYKVVCWQTFGEDPREFGSAPLQEFAQGSETATVEFDPAVNWMYVAVVLSYEPVRTVAAEVSTFGKGTVTVSPKKGTYLKGDSLTLTAQPAAGYTFVRWSDGNAEHTRNLTVSDDISLKAVIEPKSCLVTFSPGDGSLLDADRKLVSYDSAYGALPSCKRLGYAFAGWYTAEAGGLRIDSATTVTNTGEQTLHARWTSTMYSLKVNPNGGWYEGDESEQVLPEKLFLGLTNLNELAVAMRENYTLRGYYSAKTGGVKVYDANGRNVSCDWWTADYPTGTFRGKSDLTVYASWVANGSSVTLEKEGGEGGTGSVAVKYDATLPAISVPTRLGYDFEGYYTLRNGGGMKYYDASGVGVKPWTSEGTTALFANWTPHAYKVQYDLYGGTAGTEAPTAARVGASFRVSAPTKKGQAFAGWNVIGSDVDYTTAKWGVAHDAVDTAITNGSVVCFDASRDYVCFLDLATAKDTVVTLLANWSVNSYEVTFDANGGETPVPATKAVTYGEPYGELAKCKRVGYTFDGWYTAANGGTKVEAKTKVSVVEEQTLYAHWVANKYEIAFDAQGGMAQSASMTVTYDATYGTLPTCTRAGHTFDGWYTAPEGGTRIDGTSRVVITGAQTLYAHWTANEYSLTVNPNGGLYEGDENEQVQPVKLRFGTTNLSVLAVAERENYTLKGYYTSKNGGIKVYDENGRNLGCEYWTANYPTGTFKGTSDIKVYANWTAKANNVSLEKEGGEGGDDGVSVRYEMPVPALTRLPTRKGYDFEGYYTSRNGGGTKYYDANGNGLKNWTSTGMTALYANWTPHGYKVQYELGGGSAGSDAPSSAKVGTSFRVSEPKLIGHVFAGWNVTGEGVDYTAAKWGVAYDGAATSITDGSAVCIDAYRDYVYFLDLATTKDAVVTLTANWTPAEYSLTVYPNGGAYRDSTGSTTLNEKLFYGATNLNEIGEATCEGYQLLGYSTESNGGEYVYDAAGRCKSGSYWTDNHPDGTYRKTENLRVYARWQICTYEVSYEPGDFASETAKYASSKDYGKDLTLRTATYTRTGYAQDGWSRGSDGATLDYALGESYSENVGLTLYPHWKPNEYELTIDPNGGQYDGKPFVQTLTEKLVYDGTALNQIEAATKPDLSPSYGYWTSSSGGKPVYDADGHYVAGDFWTADGRFRGTANLKIYAMWGKPKEMCEVSSAVSPEGAGTVTGDGIYEKGSNVVLKATAKAGYSFWHWTNGNEVVMANPYEFAASEDAKYVAVFTGNVYKVTYHAEGGEPNEQKKTVRHGDTYGLPPSDVKKTDFHFAGWYTEPQGKGVLIHDYDTVRITKDCDLYAKWTGVQKFNVVFVDKDGKNGAITNRYDSGTTISTAPEKTKDWRLLNDWEQVVGWYPSLPVTVTSDLELTAVWRTIGKDVLDCSDLKFKVLSGWEVCTTDHVVGDSCMKLTKSGGNDILEVEIVDSGTLSFNWKKGAGDTLCVKDENGKFKWRSDLLMEEKNEQWSKEDAATVRIEGSCTLRFYCLESASVNCLIDNVTWDPDK